MYKKIAILASIVLTACSTQPVNLSNTPQIESSQLAIINNRCDAQCKSNIRQQLQVSDRYQLSEGLLLEVNGRQGTRKVTRGMVFDSALHGGLHLKVPQGVTELVIDHNSQLVAAPPARFKVELKGGHHYVIGRIRVERIPSYYYQWFPIVYDATQQKIVYGSEDLISEDQ